MAANTKEGTINIVLVKFPLKDADKGHAAFEKGGIGKILLEVE